MAVSSPFIYYVNQSAYDLRKVSSVVPGEDPSTSVARFIDNPASGLVMDTAPLLVAWQAALDASASSGVPFVGATLVANGVQGLVPAPLIADRLKYLRGDGTWAPGDGSGTVTSIGITSTDFSVSGSPVTTAGNITLDINTNAVTNAKLAQVASATLKGRSTAGVGDVEDLTGTQATALLDTFTPTTRGLVPLSGGGTANFLRADGAWVAPVGTFSGSLAAGQIAYGSGVDAITGEAAFTYNAATDTMTVGTVVTGLGSAGAPAYTFTGDTDSGIYSSAADTIGFATGNTLRMTIANTLVEVKASAILQAAGGCEVYRSISVDQIGAVRTYGQMGGGASANECASIHNAPSVQGITGAKTAVVALAGNRTKITTSGSFNSTQTVTGLAGWYDKADLGIALGGGALTITNYYGGYIADMPAVAAGVTVTNQYGIYVEGPTRGATLNRGMHINTGGAYIRSSTAAGEALILASSSATYTGNVLSISHTGGSAGAYNFVGITTNGGSVTIDKYGKLTGNVYLADSTTKGVDYTVYCDGTSANDVVGIYGEATGATANQTGKAIAFQAYAYKENPGGGGDSVGFLAEGYSDGGIAGSATTGFEVSSLFGYRDMYGLRIRNIEQEGAAASGTLYGVRVEALSSLNANPTWGLYIDTNNAYVGGSLTAAGVFLAAAGTAALPSYAFTGDPNTGIYNSAADTLGLVTDGGERLRVWPDGGVSIGGAFGASPGAGNLITAGTTGVNTFSADTIIISNPTAPAIARNFRVGGTVQAGSYLSNNSAYNNLGSSGVNATIAAYMSNAANNSVTAILGVCEGSGNGTLKTGIAGVGRRNTNNASRHVGVWGMVDNANATADPLWVVGTVGSDTCASSDADFVTGTSIGVYARATQTSRTAFANIALAARARSAGTGATTGLTTDASVAGAWGGTSLIGASITVTMDAGAASTTATTVRGISLAMTVNQSAGSAIGYTAILANVTETSVGTGAKRLLDLQVGGSSRCYVENNGTLQVAGTTASTSTTTGSGVFGGGIGVAGAGYFGGIVSAPYFRNSASQSVTASATISSGCVKFTGSTAAQTLTLPAAVDGTHIFIRNSGSVSITIARAGADTIEGATTLVMPSNTGILLIAIGTVWTVY